MICKDENEINQGRAIHEQLKEGNDRIQEESLGAIMEEE